MYSSNTQLPSRRAGQTGLRWILETPCISVLAPCEAVKGTLCSLTVQPPQDFKAWGLAVTKNRQQRELETHRLRFLKTGCTSEAVCLLYLFCVDYIQYIWPCTRSPLTTWCCRRPSVDAFTANKWLMDLHCCSVCVLKRATSHLPCSTTKVKYQLWWILHYYSTLRSRLLEVPVSKSNFKTLILLFYFDFRPLQMHHRMISPLETSWYFNSNTCWRFKKKKPNAYMSQRKPKKWRWIEICVTEIIFVLFHIVTAQICLDTGLHYAQLLNIIA